MTFLSKVGNILTLASSKQINADLSSSRPSLFQVIRCMSSSKLFDGGISYGTDDGKLLASMVKLLKDLHGRRIRVNYAADRSRGSFGGGGYGGSGVYGGGGYEGSGNFGGNDGNVSGRTYGSGSTYGDNTGADTYGSGGHFGSYGSNPDQNVGYSSHGSPGAFDTASGNFGVAGGGCGADNFSSGGFGGGIDGVVGVGSSNASEAAGDFNQDDSLESKLEG